MPGANHCPSRTGDRLETLILTVDDVIALVAGPASLVAAIRGVWNMICSCMRLPACCQASFN
jgi:hypothetical protein